MYRERERGRRKGRGHQKGGAFPSRDPDLSSLTTFLPLFLLLRDRTKNPLTPPGHRRRLCRSRTKGDEEHHRQQEEGSGEPPALPRLLLRPGLCRRERRPRDGRDRLLAPGHRGRAPQARPAREEGPRLARGRRRRPRPPLSPFHDCCCCGRRGRRRRPRGQGGCRTRRRGRRTRARRRQGVRRRGPEGNHPSQSESLICGGWWGGNCQS